MFHPQDHEGLAGRFAAGMYAVGGGEEQFAVRQPHRLGVAFATSG